MDDETLLSEMYAAFNARDVDSVLRRLDERVAWPNGMEGGMVQGHDAVHACWTRQWAVVNPRVEPRSIRRLPDGRLDVEVHQVVHDNAGTLLVERTVPHLDTLRNGSISTMEIME